VLMRILLIIPLALLLVLAGAVLAFNGGLFQDYIQREAQSALGPEARVQLGPVRLQYRWPPTLTVAPGMVDTPEANLQWQRIEAEALKVTPPYALALMLHQPQLLLKPAPKDSLAPAPKVAAPAVPARAPAQPIALSLRILAKDAGVKTDMAEVSGLNFRFEQKLLLRTPAIIHAQGSLRLKLLPVALPLSLETDSLTFSEQSVKASALKLSLGGLTANVQGTSLLQEGRHRWLVDVAVKDLGQLPQPAGADIPAKRWRGEVQLKSEINKAGADQPWQADVHFLARNVSAEIEFKHEKASVSGPFGLNAEGQFAYHLNRLSFSKLKAMADLSQARVIYGDLLSKAAGVPLKASLQAGGDQQKLKIDELIFQLWNFAGKAVGTLDLQSPWLADLRFTLQPVSLAGSERLLLPLRSSPVQGELGFSGALNGPLADPLAARVVVENLSFKKFSGMVNFEREGVAKIRGPVQVDIQAKGEWSNRQVKSAEGKGAVDFSAAALVAGPLRKEGNALLRARFNVRTQGQDMLVDEMELTSFAGNLGLKGKVGQSVVPGLDVQIQAKPLLLSELRMAMPSMRDKIPKGVLNGNWRVSGKLQMTMPWQDWPLVVNGLVDVKIPEYVMDSAPPVAQTPAAGAPAATPAPESEAFLPDGELTRKAKLAIKAQVDSFRQDTLVARAITSDGTYANGIFKGQVSVGQVFGGSVQLKNLSLPMLQANPKISGSVSWLNLVIEEALAFVKPEYKNMASGKTAGVAEFTTVMPGRPDFLNQLKVRGDVAAQPVVFNTVKIGEIINTQIAKAPAALNLKPAKVEPLRGQAKAQFELASGVVDLPSFTGIDVDNSEIQMKGKVILSNMQGDFAGTFYWNDPPVKGCLLEGNADGRGRMIVPLAIKGDLMKPGFHLLSDVMGKLAAKAAECEGKRLVEKVKADGKEQLEKELKKKLKGIFGN